MQRMHFLHTFRAQLTRIPHIGGSADACVFLLLLKNGHQVYTRNVPPSARHRGHEPIIRGAHSCLLACTEVGAGYNSAPTCHMVGKSRNMSADVLFMPGLMNLMPPTICCVRAQSVRDLVTEISGGATPAPVRCGSELEL